MRRFFTKHFLLAVLSFMAVDMMAQINTLTVNNPASAAGNYAIVRATFGAKAEVEIKGDAAFGTDANGTELCVKATNDLTGKVAFIDRGTCSFSVKAKNAEDAGAIAVIICNNVANATQDPFAMAWDSTTVVTVPVFMTGYASCQKIRAAIIAGEADVTLRHLNCINKGTYPASTVWGNGADANGNRGDFAGGMHGWTIDKAKTWHYSDNGDIVGGAYIGAAGKQTLIGWTGCDGAMVMNSDSLDNGGKTTGSGQGPCPAVCTASLISPNITLPDGIKGLTLEFSQALRQFRSEFYIYTSVDDGKTWSDPVRINQEHPTNSAHIQERKAVALIGFAGAKQIKLRFEYRGNYYYWAIDDVILKNEESPNAQVNTNYFAVAPTLRVPASQVTPMYFMTDISNLGNGDATNVNVNVVIKDEANAEVAKLTKNYGTLGAGTASENGIFDETFTPEAKPQSYNASYEIVSDKDSDAKNNTAPFIFEVTENTFGRILPEADVTPANYMKDIAAIWAVSPTNYQSFGNIYYLPKGKGYTVDKVRFGLANPIAEIDGAGFIQVELYEWNDENNDLGCQSNERTLVGSNSIFLEADAIDNPRLIELPLYAADDQGNPIEGNEVLLKDDQNYVVVAHTRPLDPSFPRMKFLTYNGFSLTAALDRSTYAWPILNVLDSLKSNIKAGSLFEIEGVDESDEADRDYNILGNTGTLFSLANMYLEMDIKQANSTYNITKTGSANVFPNPAIRELYIDVTLDNVSDVKVELVSVDGKVVMSKSFEGVQDSRLKLDINTVASGSYTAMIHTNTGVIAKKVIVQK
jgi:hypothetical protein